MSKRRRRRERKCRRRRYSKIRATGTYNLDDIDPRSACHYCEHPLCSMRHLVVECPRFAQKRLDVGFAAGLLERLPRVTTKSGWVTMSAHDDPLRRSTILRDICKLAIFVLDDLYSSHPDKLEENNLQP